jgi:DNA-binding MarR family transcriptional regulator
MLDTIRSHVYRSAMNESRTERAEDLVALLMALVHGGRITEARFDAALEAVGLSLPKWHALKQILALEEPPTLRHLATELGCVKSNATQLVDRLAADGLVRRAPDPDDRRSILIEVTDEGRSRYQAGLQAIHAVEAELLDGFSCTERKELSGLLERLEVRWG